MVPYFIVGLPRSRTAWLANFLTTGKAFCQHELTKYAGNLDAFKSVVMEGCAEYEFFGTADCGLLAFDPLQFMAAFPNSRVVIIARSSLYVRNSFRNYFEKDIPGEKWDELEDRLHYWIKCAAMFNSGWRVYDYAELNKAEVCEEIFNFCLDSNDYGFDFRRWKMLDYLKIDVFERKWVMTIPEKLREAWQLIPRANGRV